MSVYDFFQRSCVSILNRSTVAILLASALAISVPAQAQIMSGNKKDNVFLGTLESALNINGRRGIDRVEYEGSISSYGFERSSLETVRVWKQNGWFDLLRNMEAVSFGGDIIDFETLFAPTDPERNIILYQGTASADIFSGKLSLPALYSGAGRTDEVQYEGDRDQYVFEPQDDMSVNVIKPNGDIDELRSIERISFDTEDRQYAIEELFRAERQADTDQLFHFGQPVTLVGANIAWSENSRFSSDFGGMLFNQSLTILPETVGILRVSGFIQQLKFRQT